MLVTVVITDSYRIVFLHFRDGSACRHLCAGYALFELLFKKFSNDVGHLLALQGTLALDPLVQRLGDVDRQPLHRFV